MFDLCSAWRSSEAWRSALIIRFSKQILYSGRLIVINNFIGSWPVGLEFKDFGWKAARSFQYFDPDWLLVIREFLWKTQLKQGDILWNTNLKLHNTNFIPCIPIPVGASYFMRNVNLERKYRHTE